jgi:hypothetical protein
MGSSKKQTVGYKYFMGLHFGVCQGPVDALLRIMVGDRVAWRGEQTANGTIAVDAPELFGGEEREGGVDGQLDVMMGGEAQTANAYLTSVQNALQPAYRGLLSAVFRRGLVSANNPYLKPWAFTVRRVLAGWHGGAAWYPEKAMVPVEASTDTTTLSLVLAAYAGADENTVTPYLYNIPGWNATAATVSDDLASFSAYASNGSFSNRAAIIDSSDALDFAEGANFAIEFDFYPTASFLGGSHVALGRTEVNAFNYTGGHTENLLWKFVNGNSLLQFACPAIGGDVSAPIVLNEWSTYRVERIGLELRMYRNGALVSVDPCTQAAVAGNVRIGINGPYQTFSPLPNTWGNGTVQQYRNVRIFKVQIEPKAESMNPAHIVYQCLTDPEWGMGYSPTIINDASFRAAADTFHAEGMGLCLHWTQQQPIDAFVQTVMDHAGAVLRQNPRTGLFEIRPLRGDYVVGSLPLLDESNIRSLESFDRAGSAEAVNEVTVRFDDAATGKTGSVTLQNLAAVEAVGGPVARSVAYPGLPTPVLAARVAMRDLRVLSTPLARVRLRMNRQGYSILPGDVVRLAWPKLGIAQLVLRVARVNTGALADGAIEIEAVEDVFGLGASVYVAQQPVAWQPPDTAPTPIVTRAVIEAPYYELQRQLSAADLSVLAADAGYLLVGAARPRGSAVRFTIADRTAGVGEYEEAGAGDFCAAGKLAASLGHAATSVVLSAPSDPGLIETGTYALIGPEIVRVDAWDAGTSTLTIGRGVLDTVAASHAAGATILFLGAVNASDGVERVGGEAVDVKLLTVAGSGTLGEGLASADTVTFASRAARPYPPGRLRINGLAYPASAASPLQIAWAHRNRLQQNLEGDESGNIGPEPGVSYSVEIANAASGAVLHTQAGITGTSLSAPAMLGDFNVRLRVSSSRGALQSLQRHEYVFRVTGDAPGATLTAAASFDSGSSSGVSGDPDFPSVMLLLRFNGANGSTSFIDSSLRNHSVSAIGAPTISTAQSRFGGSSLSLNGSSALSIPDSEDWTFGAGNFTIEFFYYANSVASTEQMLVIHSENGDWNSALSFLIGFSSGTFRAVFNVPGTSVVMGFSSDIPAANLWHHVAVTRSGSNFRLFINGQLRGSNASSAAVNNVAAPLRIGTNGHLTSSIPFNGFIDEVRITKGVARYTANFTPPTEPFPVLDSSAAAPGRLLTADASLITGGATAPLNATAFGQTIEARAGLVTGQADGDAGAAASSVILLVHADGVNGSTSLTDTGVNGHTITAIGNAQISTAQSRFGGAALTMSGLNAGLQIGTPATRPPGFEVFSGSDWTVEGWAFVSTGETLNYMTLFAIESASAPLGTNPQFSVAIVNTGGSLALDYYLNGYLAAPPRITRQNAPTRGQWLHWAAVLQDNKLRLFLNGESTIYRIVGNETYDWVNTFANATADANVFIGRSANGYFAGGAGSYIDEVRVSARAVYQGNHNSIFNPTSGLPVSYAADFVPPGAAFVNPD